MTRFTVHLTMVVSTAITVDADTLDDATLAARYKLWKIMEDLCQRSNNLTMRSDSSGRVGTPREMADYLNARADALDGDATVPR
jgi:hypothetical protein